MDRPGLQVSRRTMLAGGVATLALSACGSEGPLLGPGMSAANTGQASGGPPLATAEVGEWIAASGSIFFAGGHRMRLAGVEQIGPAGGRPEGLRQQGFVAVFDLLDSGWLPGERTYTISHTSIPTFDIHLSNSAATPSRMVASFN